MFKVEFFYNFLSEKLTGVLRESYKRVFRFCFDVFDSFCW